MIQFLIFFIPAIVSVGLEECKDMKGYITTYAKYLLQINIIFLAAITFIYGDQIQIFDVELFKVGFSLKSLIMNTILAYFLPIINKLIIKNLKIEVKKR